MTVHFAIRDDLARRIRCARCGEELARVETVPGVIVRDADGLVVERRVANDRRRVIFGPGWHHTPEGQWRCDGAFAPRASDHARFSTALREALRLTAGKRHIQECSPPQAIEAICPECASINTIQTEEPE